MFVDFLRIIKPGIMELLTFLNFANPDVIKLLALAVAPGLAICIYVYWKDKFDKEPLHLLIKCYFLGCLAILPAIGLNKVFRSVFPIPVEWYEITMFAFFVISLSEELCKFIVLRLFAYPRKEFNEPYDGITYAVMIAMGFATTENLLYIFSQASFADSMKVGLIRMFTAVPAHATMAIMMGYFTGSAKFSATPKRYLMRGFIAAWIFHGVYDTFLAINNIPFMTAGALFSLYLSIQISMRAIILHGEKSPFRKPLRFLPFKKIASLVLPVFYVKKSQGKV